MKKIISILQYRRGVIYGRILEKGVWNEMTIRNYAGCKSYNDDDCKPKVYKCSNPTPRGCLPWETEEKELLKHLSAETECKDCKPQSLVEKLTKTICERRRIAKCLNIFRDKEKCKDIELGHIKVQKVYPFIHAIQKKYISGCPSSDWRQINQPWISPTC